MRTPCTENIRQQAQAMLDQVDALQKLPAVDLPGHFVFSPPDSSRLVVHTLQELHDARFILRAHYNWSDEIRNKFFSGGDVIVTFYPKDPDRLPLPFSIWVEGPPETFPKELLGECQIVPASGRQEYTVICPLEAAAG